MQKTLSSLFIGFLVIAAIFNAVIAARNGFPIYKTFRQHCKTREELQEVVNLTRQQIADVNRNIERFQDSSYFVERLAREQQRVTSNEVIFIFE